MELKQARQYRFKIIKGIYTDTLYGLFVLLGPDNKKYLLESAHYKHYNLQVGQEINCRIDKVNCTGQVFLEPNNPAYAAGKYYYFTIKELVKTKDIYGNEINQANVFDIHGKEWPVLINNPDEFRPGKSKIKCKVVRIKKAELELESEGFDYKNSSLEIGKYYPFIVRGIAIINGEEAFEISDSEGRLHYLNKELYDHYGLKEGEQINACVLDRKLDLSYKLEPLNPAYEINNIYNFDVIKIEKVENALGETSGIIHVKDSLGSISLVKAHDWQLNHTVPPKTIIGKVVNFKKGKLQIENLSVKPKMKE